MNTIGGKIQSQNLLKIKRIVNSDNNGDKFIIVRTDKNKEFMREYNLNREDVEKEILETGVNLDAEILKVGHHGSDTSTSEEFLNAISPDYALISTKVGNKYNHPVQSTMEKLKARNIEVYRTDECGTVIVTITSNNVSFNTEPGDYLSGPELKERAGE